MEYTAVVKRCGEWWIGWIEEVPGVNCQERTHEELSSLHEAERAVAIPAGPRVLGVDPIGRDQ